MKKINLSKNFEIILFWIVCGIAVLLFTVTLKLVLSSNF